MVQEFQMLHSIFKTELKTAVEGMTGLKVVAVNVHVQGVNTEAATEEKEDNTENEVKE